MNVLYALTFENQKEAPGAVRIYDGPGRRNVQFVLSCPAGIGQQISLEEAHGWYFSESINIFSKLKPKLICTRGNRVFLNGKRVAVRDINVLGS